jgi:hypothetical protein
VSLVITVAIVCDAHRGDAKTVVRKARSEADDGGWTQEQHGDKVLDVCPYCGIAYDEGNRGIGLPQRYRELLPDAPRPKTIGEAADWNRWRELQEAKQQGQR